MRQVAYSLWILPARSPRSRPYVSSWKMSEEQAAALGAESIVPGSTEIREVPETEEEKQRSLVNYQSAGHDAVKPPRS